MNEMTPEYIQAARLSLARSHPYLADAFFTLRMVGIRPDCPSAHTMGVDKYWRVYYCPQIIEKWSIPAISKVLYHELGHSLRKHFRRCEAINGNPVLWNLAGDAEINDNLKAEGFNVTDNEPFPLILPENFEMPEGLLAEEYYRKIEKIKGTCEGTCGGGSGVHGHNEPWELEPDKDCITEIEGELIRQQVAKKIIEDKSVGTIPKHWKRWAEKRLIPQIKWQNEIKSVIGNAIHHISGLVDFNYKRPSRRQWLMSGDFILPGFHKPVPEVVFQVDTSGSMSNKDLGQCLVEIAGAVRFLRVPVKIFSVDTATSEVKKVFNRSQVQLYGGGGTDMGKGIDLVEKMKPRPDLLIILTDGETPWPEKAPSFKVIIGLVRKDGRDPSYSALPLWAKVVKIIVKEKT